MKIEGQDEMIPWIVAFMLLGFIFFPPIGLLFAIGLICVLAKR